MPHPSLPAIAISSVVPHGPHTHPSQSQVHLELSDAPPHAAALAEAEGQGGVRVVGCIPLQPALGPEGVGLREEPLVP